MHNWIVNYEVWPYHGGKQADAGERKQSYIIRSSDLQCNDIFEVTKVARQYINGVKANPHVWQAPITSIQQLGK